VIVLDEHMSNRRGASAIKTWYKGKIVFVRDLRSGSLIKDDAIPQLLRKTKAKPAFVTVCFRSRTRTCGKPALMGGIAPTMTSHFLDGFTAGSDQPAPPWTLAELDRSSGVTL
jgi:hypothetical protein